MSTDPSSVERRRRPYWVGVGVAALIVLVAVAALALQRLRQGSEAGGPLTGPMSVTTNGLHMNPHDVATWGSVFVTNTGSGTLTLDKVTLVSDGGEQVPIAVKRAQVVPETSLPNGAIGMARGSGDKIVPESARSPLAGFKVTPGTKVALLVQYEALKAGEWSCDSMRVDYHEDHQSWHLSLRQALAVCVPVAAPCALDSETSQPIGRGSSGPLGHLKLTLRSLRDLTETEGDDVSFRDRHRPPLESGNS